MLACHVDNCGTPDSRSHDQHVQWRVSCGMASRNDTASYLLGVELLPWNHSAVSAQKEFYHRRRNPTSRMAKFDLPKGVFRGQNFILFLFLALPRPRPLPLPIAPAICGAGWSGAGEAAVMA